MHTLVSIPGIHCPSCAALIKDVSGDFPAIRRVDVDLDAKTVSLEHNDGFDLAAWSAEIESLDPKYKISPRQPA